MPRQYTLTIILDEDSFDATSIEQDLKDWKEGNYDTSDLLGVAENDPKCAVHYAIKDI